MLVTQVQSHSDGVVVTAMLSLPFLLAQSRVCCLNQYVCDQLLLIGDGKILWDNEHGEVEMSVGVVAQLW